MLLSMTRLLHSGHYRPTAWWHLGQEAWRQAQAVRATQPSLVASWRRVALGGMVAIAAATLGLAADRPLMISLLLAATSLLWWAVLMGAVFLHLGLMVEVESGQPLPAVGLANVLTMARAFAAAWVAWAIGLSVNGNFVPLAVVFGAAMATDAADGFVARRAHQVTRWGRLYDPVVDGILFGTAAVGLTLRGIFPSWLAALVVFRYAFPIAGAALFVLLRRRAVRVRHTLWGQVSTFSIAGAVFAAATLLSLGGPWPTVAPGVFAAVAVAMALSVLTIVKRGLDQL